MKKVYQAANLVDAQLCADYLEAAGVELLVKGIYLVGAIGELPVDTAPSLWVTDEAQVDHALALVREFEEQGRSRGVDWTCAQCGEVNAASFERCWSCGADSTTRSC